MKPAIFSFLITGLVLSGAFCSPNKGGMEKDDLSNNKPASGQKPSGLISSWKEIASYYSIGDANIHWADTPSDSAEIIRFQPNNVFYSNRQPERNRFLLESSATPTALKVFTEGKTDTLRWYVTPLSADTIDIALFCIEPCGKRFIRLAE